MLSLEGKLRSTLMASPHWDIFYSFQSSFQTESIHWSRWDIETVEQMVLTPHPPVGLELWLTHTTGFSPGKLKVSCVTTACPRGHGVRMAVLWVTPSKTLRFGPQQLENQTSAFHCSKPQPQSLPLGVGLEDLHELSMQGHTRHPLPTGTRSSPRRLDPIFTSARRSTSCFPTSLPVHPLASPCPLLFPQSRCCLEPWASPLPFLPSPAPQIQAPDSC